MKKSMWVTVAAALIAAGAVVMSYGVDWLIDTAGCIVMLCGALLATVIAVKNRDDKKRWIVSLVCAWLGVVVLAIAGLVRFKGVVILALAGAVLIAAYWYIEYKRRR